MPWDQCLYIWHVCEFSLLLVMILACLIEILLGVDQSCCWRTVLVLWFNMEQSWNFFITTRAFSNYFRIKVFRGHSVIKKKKKKTNNLAISVTLELSELNPPVGEIGIVPFRQNPAGTGVNNKLEAPVTCLWVPSGRAALAWLRSYPADSVWICWVLYIFVETGKQGWKKNISTRSESWALKIFSGVFISLFPFGFFASSVSKNAGDGDTEWIWSLVYHLVVNWLWVPWDTCI